MKSIQYAAWLLAAAACGVAHAAPAARQARVEIVSGNQIITSVAVPSRASIQTRADRMRSANEGGAVVLRMEGQAQVDVRDGDKLLFTLKADQLVVREWDAGMASVPPSRQPMPGSTFILG